jgi:two-component system LytT family response regulator
MLRAVIIDDEIKGIDTLRMLIQIYVPDIKIVSYSTGADEAVEIIENYKPEIVFLDINMPEMNGFELLDKLKWKEFNLVFTTAHQEYGLRALKNNAIDYLLKPIDHEDLTIAVEKIKQQLKEKADSTRFNYRELFSGLNPKQKIIISSRSGTESIELSDIICLESQSNYTCIRLINSRKIIASRTLKEFDNELCSLNSNFMRVHHSFIINLNRVSRYIKNSESVVMQDEITIPISKSRRDAFFAWMKI